MNPEKEIVTEGRLLEELEVEDTVVFGCTLNFSS